MSNTERTGSADSQLARGVLVAFALAAGVAILGPLISWRSDVAQVRAMMRQRIAQLADVYAQALARHVEVMKAELVATISVRGASANVQAEVSQYRSALFESGVMWVDASGQVQWSNPKELQAAQKDVSHEAWFQKLLSTQAPVEDVLATGTHQILVAAPSLEKGQLKGALVGLVDASRSTLPGAPSLGEGTTLLVVDEVGDQLLPNAPEWAHGDRFLARVNELVGRETGAELKLGPEPQLAAVATVGETPLRLVLVADEDPLLAPMYRRFLLQLIVIASVQTAAVFLLSLFLRQMYSRTLAAERRSVETEKLAALGAASSLIAHEVKNSLNGLNAAASLLSSGPSEHALPVKTLRGQIDRLKHLASSLLQFGKPAEARRVKTELQSLVRETVEGLKLLPEADEVEVRISGEGPLELQCDPLLLATALDNLVRNAIEAAVAAKDLGKLQRPRVDVTMKKVDGRVEIAIDDNAGGPPEGFELFRPFATTKSKGIGLGLSMAKRAMETQGGTLQFTRTAEGSRFSLQLPL